MRFEKSRIALNEKRFTVEELGETKRTGTTVTFKPDPAIFTTTVYNYETIKENIARAAVRSGRKPEDITFMAVTKTVEPVFINYAIELGVDLIGENKVQELTEKYAQLPSDIRWHMIGHLQTNKVKQAIKVFDYIHSVDSVKLAQSISQHCAEIGKIQKVLIQINNANEEQKFGFAPDELLNCMSELLMLSNIQIEGLMNIAPLSQDNNYLRNLFKNIRLLKDKIQLEYKVELPHLSMGMSNDYRIALEEGSTIIRLGRILFKEIL